MPVIYLRHPRHGEKVATMEMEAAYDESNGWVRFTPGQPAPAAPAKAPDPVVAPVAEHDPAPVAHRRRTRRHTEPEG